MAVATSSSSYTVNVTCTTAEKAFAPPGGIKLRVRSPSFLHGSKISQVTVGGQPWSQLNASEETILFKSVTDEMQHIDSRAGKEAHRKRREGATR